jgi:hypothetical protein
MFIVVAIAVIFGGWVVATIIWALTARPKFRSRSVGISPFTKRAPLEDGERTISELGAISRSRGWVALRGMLYFTDRRLIFAPDRQLYIGIRGDIQLIRYDEIREWHTEKLRQIGIGTIVPFRSPALLVSTTRGQEFVYWSAPGYDIVSKARAGLPSAREQKPVPEHT